MASWGDSPMYSVQVKRMKSMWPILVWDFIINSLVRDNTLWSDKHSHSKRSMHSTAFS